MKIFSFISSFFRPKLTDSEKKQLKEYERKKYFDMKKKNIDRKYKYNGEIR